MTEMTVPCSRVLAHLLPLLHLLPDLGLDGCWVHHRILPQHSHHVADLDLWLGRLQQALSNQVLQQGGHAGIRTKDHFAFYGLVGTWAPPAGLATHNL